MWTPRPLPCEGSIIHTHLAQTFNPPIRYSLAGGIKEILLESLQKPINTIGWLVSDNRSGKAYRFTGIYSDPAR